MKFNRKQCLYGLKSEMPCDLCSTLCDEKRKYLIKHGVIITDIGEEPTTIKTE